MLRAVIESQNTIFKEFIIELANNSLTHSSKIIQKQASLSCFGECTKLNVPFVPCSTRINLELTTSEEFQDDLTFTNLRDELKAHVSEFQNQATATMRKWAAAKIMLLKIK